MRVAINGFGRIGRNILRASLKDDSLEFIAVNDLTSTRTLAHLLKYDSIFGILEEDISANDGELLIGERRIKVFAEKDPSKLPWKELEIDIVFECTGRFTSRDKATLHLDAGAKRVIISAPAKDPDITICMGVNEEEFNPQSHKIISNASCTTNCLAPVAKVLMKDFGIVKGFMTTVHSYTNDQRILDLPHEDLRRARAAAVSIIPTTTGAARAVGLVIPELKGRLDGIAVRVPVANVSLVDLVVELERDVSKEVVNMAIKEASESYLRGILQYWEDECVSIDFKGNPHSSIFDAPSTKVIGSRMVKILAWYDNEWAFSCRMRDLAKYIKDRVS